MPRSKNSFKPDWQRFIQLSRRCIFNFLILIVIYSLIWVFHLITQRLNGQETNDIFDNIINVIHKGGGILFYLIITLIDLFNLFKNGKK